MKPINFAFHSLSIDDKKTLYLLLQRSGLSFLQSQIRWIEKLNKPTGCNSFIDFNGDDFYINTSGIGAKCNNVAIYKIVYKSGNQKTYSKNICTSCIKNSIMISFKRIIEEIKG